MYYYVYGITHKFISKKYIGARKSKVVPEEDIGIKYFSSSHDKNFMLEQKEHPERFLYEVLQEFSSREEAIIYEIELHHRYNVGINKDFYNLSRQTSTGFDRTGLEVKEETREKLRVASKKQKDYFKKNPSDASKMYKENGILISDSWIRRKKDTETYSVYIDKRRDLSSQHQREIRSDPIKLESRRQKLIKNQLDIKNNPERLKEVRYNQSVAQLGKKAGIKHHGARAVIQLELNGDFVKYWPYAGAAEEAVPVKAATIRKCARGINKTSGGYIWLYVDTIKWTVV